MEFIYFKGPFEDISGLLKGSHNCSICGLEHSFCFALDYAITDKFNEEQKKGKVGCYTWLRKGEFEVWHDTEFGFLDKKGLSRIYNHNMANPPTLAQEILTQMRRTPRIVTWQQELWLTHCYDFMVYKGTWTPNDFYANSSNGQGRELFLQMTDEEYSHLWDESLGADEEKL